MRPEEDDFSKRVGRKRKRPRGSVNGTTHGAGDEEEEGDEEEDEDYEEEEGMTQGRSSRRARPSDQPNMSQLDEGEEDEEDADEAEAEATQLAPRRGSGPVSLPSSTEYKIDLRQTWATSRRSRQQQDVVPETQMDDD